MTGPTNHAPWTPEEVQSIRLWQEAKHVHPLTCMKCPSEFGVLQVYPDRLECACGYVQYSVPQICVTVTKESLEKLSTFFIDPSKQRENK